MSPLFWNLVVDELIRLLEGKKIFTVGYADDFGIFVKGRYEEVLPDLLQGALEIVRVWCTENDLAVNPDKTEIVPFTRKYKSKIVKEITFYGKKIPYAEGVKYLGLHLDKKLNWNQHLQMQGRKVLNIFMQCRSAIGTGWGLEPQKALWIYEAILKPKLLYAAVIWWKVTENKTSRTVLEHIQAVTLRGIFGVRRSTPTAAIRMLIGVGSLDLEIKGRAAKTAYRLVASSEWVELRTGHATILSQLRNRDLFKIPQDRTQRHLLFGNCYKTSIPSRED